MKLGENNLKTSIVIPTLNEEKNLPYLLDEISNSYTSAELIVVDGYSDDRTVEIAKKYNCKILYDRKGKGSAMRKGIQKAKGKIIVLMDADNSMIPNEIQFFIKEIEDGCDLCLGSRFMKGGGTDDMPFIRIIGNKFFVKLINFFWKVNFTDTIYGFKSLKKSIIKDLNLKSNSFDIEVEITIKAVKNNLKIKEIPAFERKRLYGYGKLRTFLDGWIIFKKIFNELLNH